MKRCRPVTIKIKTDGNDYRSKCVFDGSVRGHSVAFTIRGGDEWAHLSKEQAIRLSEWLKEAVDEIDRRRQPNMHLQADAAPQVA